MDSQISEEYWDCDTAASLKVAGDWELELGITRSVISQSARKGIKVTYLLGAPMPGFVQLSAVRSVTENKFLQISGGLDRSGGRDHFVHIPLVSH